MLGYIDMLFILALVIVILFALIAGAVLFLCYKWRREEVDEQVEEEAARRMICFIRARPDLVKKWLEEVAQGKQPS
jgi:heme/copper-type cytochrome/quinol oxidase subunit 2